jgi:uncharacterized membrane protein YccC
MQPILDTFLTAGLAAFLLAAGAAIGWLACSIVWAAKYRRCRNDTWREASRHYARHFHQLISKL